MWKRCAWKRQHQQNNEKRQEEKQTAAERKKCGLFSHCFLFFTEYNWLINVNTIKYVPGILLMLFLIHTIFLFLFSQKCFIFTNWFLRYCLYFDEQKKNAMYSVSQNNYTVLIKFWMEFCFLKLFYFAVLF